jgi:hypothetical protein
VLSDTSADEANAGKGWDNETHIEQDQQGNSKNESLGVPAPGRSQKQKKESND